MGDSASGNHTGKSAKRALSPLVQMAVLPAVISCASSSQLVEYHPLEFHPLAQLTTLPAVIGRSSSSQLAERHPLDRHGAPKAVAVLASPEAPKTRVQPFARGLVESVATGAGAAEIFGLVALSGPATILYLPVFAAAGAAVGLAAGAAARAEDVVPEERAAAIQRLAADALDKLQLLERTAAAVAGITKKFAELDAAVVENAMQGDSSAHAALRERGFGVAIEVKVKDVGFEAVGADTIMSLFLTAEATLVDTKTGRPVAQRGLVYVSPQHAHQLWTRDSGALTHAEIERAYNTLAERMVEDLLLGAAAGSARPGTALDICGLAPRSPAHQWTGPGLAAPTVESVTPMLAWETAPSGPWSSSYHAWNPNERPIDATPWGRGKQSDITYDLRIWSVADGAPDALIYERLKLPHPRHRVETALEPGSTYLWSVRMRYVVDGRVRATRWSAAAEPEFRLGTHLGDALFYAVADNGSLKRAVCTACQCLDFTPAPNRFRFTTP